MDPPRQTLPRFCSALRERLGQLPESAPEVSGEAASVLALLPAEETRFRRPPGENWPAPPPVVAWLETALSQAQVGPEAALAAAVSAFASELVWTFGYPPDPRWPGLGSSVGFADIIGKSGLLAAADLVVGLTLLAPHTYYPLHAHPAVELYLVLSGTAEWTAGPSVAIRPAGSLILHPAQLPHAMKTHDEPLLALFTWSGDIRSSSVFVE
ncbi:dimethylsulfonioproprionate lyase family protein [Labrys okinawensis]|uniref:dimethylsulfonioproprionate lyase family protein n=1 Tax=Labrys okinawensis TaxID=346911 RepID=UPI0039BD2710